MPSVVRRVGGGGREGGGERGDEKAKDDEAEGQREEMEERGRELRKSNKTLNRREEDKGRFGGDDMHLRFIGCEVKPPSGMWENPDPELRPEEAQEGREGRSTTTTKRGASKEGLGKERKTQPFFFLLHTPLEF